MGNTVSKLTDFYENTCLIDKPPFLCAIDSVPYSTIFFEINNIKQSEYFLDNDIRKAGESACERLKIIKLFIEYSGLTAIFLHFL